MLHLLFLEYTGPAEDTEPYVAGHVAYLERHHADGTFLVSGQTVPADRGGAIVARGVDRATVERVTAEDPFVVHGVARYTVVTIAPGRVHPTLEPLLMSGGRHAAG